MDDFTTILNRMKENFKSVCGYAPGDVSDEGLRLQAYAAEILDCKMYAKWLEDQMFVQTASGKSLDMHAIEYGLSRLKGSKAIGEVFFTLYEILEQPVTIPKGTKVINTNGFEYTTDDECVIEKGINRTSVKITAVKEGSGGNCGVGDIKFIDKDNEISAPGISVKGLVSVKNTTVVIGGTDEECDELLRKRILEAARFPSTGANKTYYTNLATEVEGVRSVGFAGSMTESGTLYMYLGGEGTPVTTQMVNMVQSKIDRLGQIGIDVTVFPAVGVTIDMTLYVSAQLGYSIKDIKDNCKTAITQYIKTRSVGEKITEQSIVKYLINNVEGLNEVVFDTFYELPNILNNEIPVIGNIVVDQM